MNKALIQALADRNKADAKIKRVLKVKEIEPFYCPRCRGRMFLTWSRAQFGPRKMKCLHCKVVLNISIAVGAVLAKITK